MRVLILSNMYPSPEKPYSGVFVRNQVQSLKDCGADDMTIDVCAMRRRFTSRFGSILKYCHFLISIMPCFFIRYDVIHLHFFTPLGVVVWLYKKIYRRSRIVVTFHGSDLRGPYFSGRLRKFWNGISSSVDVAIAVGPEIYSIVNQELRCRESVLIPAGVDEAVFYREPSMQNKFDFVFVGSLIEKKGIDLVIQCISDDLCNARWCIIGTGAYETRIKSLEHDRKIVYLKALDQGEIRHVLNQSKWLVMPSRKEAFGLVATEALFCGTPVVCSDELGLRMQVQDDHNGLIVRAGDYASLHGAVCKAMLMSDERYAAFVRAARSSNRDFSLKTVTAQLLAVYRGENDKLCGRPVNR